MLLRDLRKASKMNSLNFISSYKVIYNSNLQLRTTKKKKKILSVFIGAQFSENKNKNHNTTESVKESLYLKIPEK